MTCVIAEATRVSSAIWISGSFGPGVVDPRAIRFDNGGLVVDSTVTPSSSRDGGIDPDLQPGQIVGEYRVESKLGQGGFGAVF